MNKKTRVLDGSNLNVRHQKQIITNDDFMKEIVVKSKEQKKSLSALKNIGLAAGGLGVGFVAIGFMPTHAMDVEALIPIPEEPQCATTVRDGMSYNEAFDAARGELGAGHFFIFKDNIFSTYTQEEWSRLDAEDRAEHEKFREEQVDLIKEKTTEEIPFVVHDESPIVSNVNDSMSFDDAFAVARQEVGPGGVFKWHGNYYNTYYENEWNSMDDADKELFAQSVNYADLDSRNIRPSQMEVIHQAIEVNDVTNEIFLGSETLQLETGETILVGYFQQANELIMKLDVDGDNSYDYIYDITSNQLIGLNGNPDIDINQLNDINPSNNEPVMSEYVTIEGYNALVTTFADGTQQVQLDLDGNGTFETTLEFNPETGDISAYDANNQLILEDNVYRYDNYEEIEPPTPDPTIEPDLYPESEPYPEPDPLIYFTDNQQDDFGDDFNSEFDVNDWT